METVWSGFHSLRRISPLIVFLLVAGIGGFITFTVRSSEMAENRARFEAIADDVASRISRRVQQHIALLVASSAYLGGTGDDVARSAFFQFVSGLDLEHRFAGIRGIGYAKILDAGAERGVRERLARDYAIDREVWPESDHQVRTAILLLEPADERNRAALGYDMFTEKDRRQAMWRAMQTGESSATAPVTLVQEITSDKQAGFLVYHPLRDRADQRVVGLVYAPFRASDLHDAVFDRRSWPLEIQTRDRDAEEDVILYTSAGFDESGGNADFRVERAIDVAGRVWVTSVQATPQFIETTRTPFAWITGLTSLLLAVAIGAATRWQLQSVDRARELVELQNKTLQEKDLMLQEMKHRIKNSIARILAIARQTAAGSGTVEEFSESFVARLQSMANAQDMLTRSHWQGAALRDLVLSELEQVYGASVEEGLLQGPDVMLSGVQTQALGITLHELATNSMKYGAGSHADAELSVSWRIGKQRGRNELILMWQESTLEPVVKPDSTGFGTRLIDASITGELGGKIERRYGVDGLTVEIRIPDVSDGN